ncbi:MAG: DUF177 domain-containing protein [Pararhodobacter sp.]|nr:DUF177 domain-containing protein [Pararhodobacter sp.]
MRVADLSPHRAHRFHLRPDAPARARLAGELGLLALRKLDFRGDLRAEGRQDWRLEAALGATVVQPCVISAEPVSTRIDITVTRLFRPPPPEDTGQGALPEEMEMPEDDSIEPLGAVIDPGAVMAEALALALPDYPRAPGAGLGEQGFVVTPPGAAPTEPERKNPFAALEALKKRDGGAGEGG